MVKGVVDLYKNAYRGLSKNSWYLSVVMLINRSGTMVVPFMTLYCTEKLQFSITQAGIVMALFGLGAIVGAFIGGRITDSFGFYALQVAALFTGGLMFIIVGFLQTFISLCIGTFILSVCNESFRPANSTAIAFYSKPENQTRSYSLNRLAINLGWAAGGALGGFLASYNYQLLFWVDGLTNISAGVLLLILLPPAKNEKRKTKSTETNFSGSAYTDKTYLCFIGLVILVATCFFQFFTMQPVFYKTSWGFDEKFIGVLMALNGLIIGFLEMVLIYRLEGTKPSLFFISIGILLIGLGFGLLNLFAASAIIAILSVVILTFGEMFAMPFMNSFWISRSTPGNRGQYAALYTMAWSTAQILAPTVGSQVIQQFGFSTLWWYILLICIIVATAFSFLQKVSIKYSL